MNALIIELSKPQYAGLSDQQAADAINAAMKCNSCSPSLLKVNVVDMSTRIEKIRTLDNQSTG